MKMYDTKILHHGGDLESASRRFNVPLNQWLDLSTGVSKNSYPIPDIPKDIWQRLPGSDLELIASASRYYNCAPDFILPIPGSQYAIQQLPQLFKTSRVALPTLGYQEHVHAWQQSEHSLFFYDDNDLEQLEQDIINQKYDVVVVINPNNPTCQFIDQERLRHWHKHLVSHGGCLILDEAFIDTHPEHSLSAYGGNAGLIVLRSFGKFFGLAGIRLGFLIAPSNIYEKIEADLGPWSVNGQAQWIGQQALENALWQNQARNCLKQNAERLTDWLINKLPQSIDPKTIRRTDFFVSMVLPEDAAQTLYQHMGENGILLRIIPTPLNQTVVRIGFPEAENEWQLFQDVFIQAVEHIMHEPENNHLNTREYKKASTKHVPANSSI